MMKVKQDAFDVGVIVGRFQVPYLHEAHIELIQTVVAQHTKVIIFLGLSPCKVTSSNPLDFECRKQMILAQFPDVIVQYAKDNPSDETWSSKLDETITDLIGPRQSVVLYGSRDSFIPHYHGRFKTAELEQKRYISGTEIRKEISNKVKATPDFRAGVIWAVSNQYDKVHPTVDAVIFKDEKRKMLLARKPHETKLRFIGGFASTKGTYEEDVRREVMEEAQIEISEPVYLGSFVVDDWRYRKEQDKIKTLVFTADYMFGSPKASDDICELQWVYTSELQPSMLVKEHVPIYELLAQKGIIQ
jgi:bifunctional NMN adenylyltransferase/nudix hydrolase